MCGPLRSSRSSLPRCCPILSSPIHFSTSRPVLLIIKPDYGNTSESQNPQTISNINKNIWQKGHWQHSANAGVNCVVKRTEGWWDIYLYFAIFFAGLFDRVFPEREPKLVLEGGGVEIFPCFCNNFLVTAKEITSCESLRLLLFSHLNHFIPFGVTGRVHPWMSDLWVE